MSIERNTHESQTNNDPRDIVLKDVEIPLGKNLNNQINFIIG